MRNMLRHSLALTLAATAATAQIRLPGLPLTGTALPQTLGQVETHSLERLEQLRHLEIRKLIRANRATIDVDPDGDPIVRAEVLALSPGDEAMTHAASMGFAVVRERSVDALDMHIAVLRSPAGMSTGKALRALREADPSGVYEYNHLYGGSASRSVPDSSAPSGRGASPSGQGVSPSGAAVVRIGLLDSGVDVRHEVFRQAHIHTWGCDGKRVAAAHGTAVASLLIGRAQNFQGLQPNGQLYAADVYCGLPTGGAADALVSAFGWMAEQRVPVINVSLVGPRNALLERVIARLVDGGFLIVAAVGNDGPAAAPLFPASYPGVIGVTAIDSHRHALIEAARGPQVMFAAPGADLPAAALDHGYVGVRGTSFAAPIVAGLLAAQMGAPGKQESEAAIDQLKQAAVHAGAPGRDLTYGYGMLEIDYPKGRN